MTRPSALPERFRDVEHLEDVMTTPSPALIAAFDELPGDLMVLGVGGKIGPSLAQLAKRAAPGRRVVGVARFSEKGLREKLAASGIECIEADLLDRSRSRRSQNSPMWCSWLDASSAPPVMRT